VWLANATISTSRNTTSSVSASSMMAMTLAILA
jgi:hypothetical protein